MTDTGAIPCSPWDAIFCCDISGYSSTITGQAVEAASEIMYQLSGQRFGICEFTVRPCRDNCNDGGWPYSGNWWQWGYGGGVGGMWPIPFNYGGLWYNLTCGGCSGTCSCTPLSQATLPSPVAQVLEVKVDGAVLVAGTDYRVDDFRKLVRLGGESWPVCQDLNLADTEPDTWSVTFTVGEEVPVLGRMAVGELACEIMAACAGGDCVIPRSATQITRQGITYDFPTLQELLERGLLGLRWTDTFIATYNPNRLRSVPKVYDVDGEHFRRVNT